MGGREGLARKSAEMEGLGEIQSHTAVRWLSLEHTFEEVCATYSLTAYSCFSWQKQPSDSMVSNSHIILQRLPRYFFSS